MYLIVQVFENLNLFCGYLFVQDWKKKWNNRGLL